MVLDLIEIVVFFVDSLVVVGSLGNSGGAEGNWVIGDGTDNLIAESSSGWVSPKLGNIFLK